jgi:hypothetical protein
MELQGYRSHGEPFELEGFTIPRSADPPAPGGVGINSAGATAAVSGGADGGFSLSIERLEQTYGFLQRAVDNEWHLPTSVLTTLTGQTPEGCYWKALGFEFLRATRHGKEIAWAVSRATWDFPIDGQPCRA